MESYSKSLVKWYKEVFNDEDLVFLLAVTLMTSIVLGLIVKNYLIINGGSIFIVCGAAIAGVLSYMAIESAREVREKEIERGDIKEFSSMCFELTIKLLSFKREVSKISQYIREKKKISKKRNEMMVLVQSEESNDFKKLDLKGDWDALDKDLAEVDGMLEDRIEGLENRYNKVIESCSHLRIMYTSLMYNHKLEGVDLDRVKDYLEDYTTTFTEASLNIFEDIKNCVNDENGNVEMKEIKDYLLPSTEGTYPELEKLVKSPGMSVYKESKQYKLIKNRCLSIAMFFAVVGVINGFQFQ